METYKVLLQKQREFFLSGQTREISFRIQQLLCLKEAVKTNEKKIFEALRADLNKSEYEALLTEVGFLYAEIDEMLKSIKRWAKPEKVKTPLSHVGSQSFIYQEPYGVVLIIAPWNYPFQLAIAPLIGAIAAGNCAVIKPSELTPHTSKLLAEIIDNAFDDQYISVVEGDVSASQALLSERFDYIFFTGSTEVGKVVMSKAAEHLTPVTLELGGKSPAIVHHDAKMKLAAKRIVWGKYLNSGQTCVAPDYLLVHEQGKEELLTYLKEAIKDFTKDVMSVHGSFTQIVNDKHFERLMEYVKEGTVLVGGKAEIEKRTIEPTVMTDMALESRIMNNEIFGPILPVFTYKEIEEAVAFVRNFPNPLALYLFTENSKHESLFIDRVSFGGGCINDTIYHLGNPYLPFGGIGQSGMGAYRGKYSFTTFSHQKGVLKQTSKFDFPFRYPSKKSIAMIRRFFK